MEKKTKINKLIKTSLYIIVIVLIISVIALMILKYNVEGEKNMPFKLSNIIVISNAQGVAVMDDNSGYLWNEDIYQNNDIYLNIEKNKNYKETEIIKSLTIDNIKIDNNPEIGTIEFYRTSNEEKNLFTYSEEYKIKDNIEWIGDIESDLKNLKVSNQGGTIIISVVNKTGKLYKSNDEEFEHNGKLLEKVGVTYEEIKTNISFDLIINLESGVSFKANIKLKLPVGNIILDGSSSLEKTDLKDIIFKRE